MYNTVVIRLTNDGHNMRGSTPGGTPNNGLYREALPKMGTVFMGYSL